MSPQAELSETTLVFEHSVKTVELYTTSRRLWLRAIRRNPNFLEVQELNPGYRLVYSMDQVKGAETVLRQAPGGDDALLQFLTEQEVEHRAELSTRAKAIFVRDN